MGLLRIEQSVIHYFPEQRIQSLKIGDAIVDLNAILSLSFATSHRGELTYGVKIEYEKPCPTFWNKNSRKVVSHFINCGMDLKETYEKLKSLGSRINFMKIGKDHFINQDSVLKASEYSCAERCSFGIKIDHHLAGQSKPVTRYYSMEYNLQKSQAILQKIRDL